MTQREINRVAEMEVFVTVVEQNGLSAAARERRMTPSAVSKLVSRLEARLGTQLLARSTRRLRLTPEGDLFYQHARRILADTTRDGNFPPLMLDPVDFASLYRQQLAKRAAAVPGADTNGNGDPAASN